MALQDMFPDITTMINNMQANSQTANGPLGKLSAGVNQPSAGAQVSMPNLGQDNTNAINNGTAQSVNDSPAPPIPEGVNSPMPPSAPSSGNWFDNVMGGLKTIVENPISAVGNGAAGLISGVGTIGGGVTGAASPAISAVGDAVHNITSPLLENPFIQQLLGAVNKASATAPIGQSLNQAEQLLGGVTGSPVPTVYGGMTGANGTTSSNGKSGGLLTPYDQQIDTLTQKGQYLTSALAGMPTSNPQYQMYQKALDDNNTQLKNLYGLQGDYRTNAGAIGQYAAGSDGAKNIVATGQENERMIELKQNLGRDLSVENPDSVQLTADIQAIRNDNVLLEGFKRMPGGDAAQDALSDMDSSLDGLIDPSTGVINPLKLKGVLKAINNTSDILGHNYDTQMRQGQVYDSTANGGKGNGDLVTAQRYNRYYQTPDQANAKNILDSVINRTDLSKDGPMANTAVNQAQEGGYVSGRYQAAQTAGKGAGYLQGAKDLTNTNGPQLPNGVSQEQYSKVKYLSQNGNSQQQQKAQSILQGWGVK